MYVLYTKKATYDNAQFPIQYLSLLSISEYIGSEEFYLGQQEATALTLHWLHASLPRQLPAMHLPHIRQKNKMQSGGKHSLAKMKNAALLHRQEIIL